MAELTLTGVKVRFSTQNDNKDFNTRLNVTVKNRISIFLSERSLMRLAKMVDLPILALTLTIATSAYGQRVCSSPFPFPRFPIQANVSLPAVAAAQDTKTPTKVQVIRLDVVTPPRDRFIVIDSIAFKGIHPGNTYLAIELRTTTSVSFPVPTQSGQSVGPPVQKDWVRHFLYSKSSQNDSSALDLRARLNIYGAPGMPVYIGVQSSSAVALEQMDIAISGYWVDACKWGQ